jgi:uncharacterized protein
MKQTVLIVGLFLTLVTQSKSQSLTKKEKIKALFTIMKQDSLMIKTMDGITRSMVDHMTNMYKDSTYSKMEVDVSIMVTKLMEKSLQKSKENALKLLHVDMVDIYDKYFTVEEIDDFTNFYKSQSGQKMLTQTPNISQDIMTIMTTKYQSDFQQTIMKDLEEIRNEMAARIKAKQK